MEMHARIADFNTYRVIETGLELEIEEPHADNWGCPTFYAKGEFDGRGITAIQFRDAGCYNGGADRVACMQKIINDRHQ